MARAARYRSRGIACAGQHAMAEAKAEDAAPPRYEADEDTVECAGGAPAGCFSALPSRGKTSPRHETHHLGIRIYITHRNSERAPFNCLCLCDLRSLLAVPSGLLFFSSSAVDGALLLLLAVFCVVSPPPPCFRCFLFFFFCVSACAGVLCPWSCHRGLQVAAGTAAFAPSRGYGERGGWWWWLFSLF